MHPTEDKSATRLLLLAGIACTLSGIGLARFAFAAILPDLILQEYFSESQATLMSVINLIGYTLGALLAPRLAQQYSAIRIIKISSLLVTGTTIFSVYFDHTLLHYVFRILGGLGGGALMASAPSFILSQLPEARRAAAQGVIFTGIGIGIVFTSVVSFASSVDVANGWMLLSFFCIACTLVIFLCCPSAKKTPSISDNVETPITHGGRKILIALLIAYALDAVGFIPHTLFWVDYLKRNAGFSSQLAAIQWGLFGVGAVVGPISISFLAKRLGWQKTLIVALFTKAAAIGIPALTTHIAFISLSSFFVGALVPGIVTAVSGVLCFYFGVQRLAKMWGLATAVFAVTQALAGGIIAPFYTILDEAASPIFALCALALLLAGCIQVFAMIVSRKLTPSHITAPQQAT